MGSTKAWPVHGFSGKNRSYLLVQGWRTFCQENSLKEGDICTFNVIETALWHVVIERCEEKMNQFCYQETPSASSRKCKSKYKRPGSERQKKQKGSMISLNKASSKKIQPL
uniref:TF-B3 domain-containing protein n=1 Tax=Arundo donax TaxID=35708 RepID=A0A0A8Y6K6_ARUDO